WTLGVGGPARVEGATGRRRWGVTAVTGRPRSGPSTPRRRHRHRPGVKTPATTTKPP
ncbi:MAG: hypothetical protein AVDCRST_MAG19-567, partial [uncultured Thermomicrobiales bacterium]